MKNKSIKWPPYPFHHHHHHHHHQQQHHLRSPSPSVRLGYVLRMRMGGETAAVRRYYCRSDFFFTKMASSQGGVGAVTALQSHHCPSGPHWSPGVSQYQHQQQQHHTTRSLDRALEDAVCSGLLNLSGRKLREYPGVSYDLTDTTQAGGLRSKHESYGTTRVREWCENARMGLCV